MSDLVSVVTVISIAAIAITFMVVQYLIGRK
jgi:hypothetical protein